MNNIYASPQIFNGRHLIDLSDWWSRSLLPFWNAIYKFHLLENLVFYFNVRLINAKLWSHLRAVNVAFFLRLIHQCICLATPYFQSYPQTLMMGALLCGAPKFVPSLPFLYISMTSFTVVKTHTSPLPTWFWGYWGSAGCHFKVINGLTILEIFALCPQRASLVLISPSGFRLIFL